VTIVTRRTLLIPYTESFESDFLMLNCCAKNRAKMNGPKTVAAAKQLFQRVMHDTSLHSMAVLDNYNREFMGHVFIEVDGQSSELGFIFDKLYWGQGLATEALKAFFHKECRQLNLDRVKATVNVGHKPAIAILHSLGFQNKGENDDGFSPYYEFEWVSDEVISSDVVADEISVE